MLLQSVPSGTRSIGRRLATSNEPRANRTFRGIRRVTDELGFVASGIAIRLEPRCVVAKEELGDELAPTLNAHFRENRLDVVLNRVWADVEAFGHLAR